MPKPSPALRPDALLAPGPAAPAPDPLAHAAPPRLCSSTCLGPPVAHGRLEASRSALGVCRKQSPGPRALSAAARCAGSLAQGQPRAQQLRPAPSDSGGCVCPALSDPAQLASVLPLFAPPPPPPRRPALWTFSAVLPSVALLCAPCARFSRGKRRPRARHGRRHVDYALLQKPFQRSTIVSRPGTTIPTSCARPCVFRAARPFVYCRAGSSTPAPTSSSVQRRHLSNAIPTLSLCLHPAACCQRHVVRVYCNSSLTTDNSID